MNFGVFQDAYTQQEVIKGPRSATGVIGTTMNGVMYLSMPILSALLERSRFSTWKREVAVAGTLIPEEGFQGNPTDRNGEATRLLTRPCKHVQAVCKGFYRAWSHCCRLHRAALSPPKHPRSKKRCRNVDQLATQKSSASVLSSDTSTDGEQPKRAREPNSNRTPISGLQRSGDNRSDWAREPSLPPGLDIAVHMSPDTGS